MQNISFTSKIVVVDKFKTFLDFMYDDKNKRCEIDETIKGKDLYTLRAATCLAGGATNQKDCFMFHYCEPTTAEVGDVCDKFESLSRDDKKANALITAGFADGASSKRYYDKFMNRFKPTNIEPSILWGQENGDTSVHYSAEKDTWTLYCDKEKINSFDDLKKAYKIVKIADGDELWINNKKIKTKA